MHNYYVYIVAGGFHGTLYIGVTNNLIRRIAEHKAGKAEGFTKSYNVSRLVYFEHTESIEAAITREKQLKNWHREWKMNLIAKDNPQWLDLYDGILGKVDAETSSA